MLLPSAFLCEGPAQSRTNPHHARAQSMTSPPAPPTHRRTSSTITSDIYTSCRALQSRLSANLSHSPLQAPHTPTLLPSPVFTAGATAMRAREGKPKPAPERPQTPPRGARKRRRSISDDKGHESIRGETCNGPSTPKRQRLAPPSIPLGLSPGDFDGLERLPKSPKPPHQSTNAVVVRPKALKRTARPNLSVATINPYTYPSSLVSLIIQKLSLNEEGLNWVESKKEDIDERWRSLLAESETARGQKVRREMVIRRGRRERRSLGVLDGVWFAGKD